MRTGTQQLKVCAHLLGALALVKYIIYIVAGARFDEIECESCGIDISVAQHVNSLVLLCLLHADGDESRSIETI